MASKRVRAMMRMNHFILAILVGMQNIQLLAHTPPLSLAVWTARGADARRFLQGQLTQDTLRLEPMEPSQAHAHQLTGLCTPKGRLLASLQQWSIGEQDLAHLAPSELTPALIKRLSMYVLRAKVQIASEPWEVRGAWLGPSDIPQGYGLALGEALWCLRTQDDPSQGPRAWLVGPSEALARWIQTTQQAPAERTESDWWTSEVQAGWPTVWPQTQDAFVPQMINFDLLDGIGFKKGCYTGQEVVARSQYLGKLNRRMFRMTLAEPLAQPVLPGTDIWGGGLEPVGSLVMMAESQALVSISLDGLAEASKTGLHLGSREGPSLTLASLPYNVPTEPQQVNRPKL
jgi:folate-binding protein YgfZ